MNRRLCILLCVFLATALAPASFTCAADTWKAGVARIKITPEQPINLSGYKDRLQPTDRKLHDLWAKALVLEDAKGQRVSLVTMDLLGINRELSLAVRDRVEKQHGIPRANQALAASHTHTGPVVGKNLPAIEEYSAEQLAVIDAYAAGLTEKLVQVVGEAIADLRPVELSYAVGTATIAVNRRNNPEPKVPELRAENKLAGPVDHDAPVLKITDPDGKLRGIMFGYACHATVLNDVVLSGDWPGFAQIELEKRHPEVTALFWAGCGGDQNPLPRRSVELAQGYGRQMADAVDAVLAKPMEPIAPRLQTAYTEIDLPLADLPSREVLEKEATGSDAPARRAKLLLSAWDRDGHLISTYPYPVQIWRLGADLEWILLGGEVVVDYSLRLKQSPAKKATWVASYFNDVMAYIPSRRVLLEGGYEGLLSMTYYGLPGKWDASVEERIVKAVDSLREQLSK